MQCVVVPQVQLFVVVTMPCSSISCSLHTHLSRSLFRVLSGLGTRPLFRMILLDDYRWFVRSYWVFVLGRLTSTGLWLLSAISSNWHTDLSSPCVFTVRKPSVKDKMHKIKLPSAQIRNLSCFLCDGSLFCCHIAAWGRVFSTERSHSEARNGLLTARTAWISLQSPAVQQEVCAWVMSRLSGSKTPTSFTSAPGPGCTKNHLLWTSKRCKLATRQYPWPNVQPSFFHFWAC